MDELIEFQRKLWRWLGKLKAAKVKRSYFSTNAQTVFLMRRRFSANEFQRTKSENTYKQVNSFLLTPEKLFFLLCS